MAEAKAFTAEEIAAEKRRVNHPCAGGGIDYSLPCYEVIANEHERARRFLATIRERDTWIAGQTKRLVSIALIIESVDNRCMAGDGPVSPTLDEMTQDEISRIYRLAKGEAP